MNLFYCIKVFSYKLKGIVIQSDNFNSILKESIQTMRYVIVSKRLKLLGLNKFYDLGVSMAYWQINCYE